MQEEKECETNKGKDIPPTAKKAYDGKKTQAEKKSPLTNTGRQGQDLPNPMYG